MLRVSLISCLVFTPPLSLTTAYIYFTFIVVVFMSASTVAFAKLSVVLVSPFALAHTSFIPAISSTFLAVPPAARPSPLGAGLSSTVTLPALPLTEKGTVWVSPQPHSHEPHPLLRPLIFILALSIAFLIAIPT